MKCLLIPVLIAGMFTTLAEPVELLKNGTFESVKDGKAVGWERPNKTAKGRHLIMEKGAFEGNHSLRFECEDGAPGNYNFYLAMENAIGIPVKRGGVPVEQGATYEISCFARGEGMIFFLLPASGKENYVRAFMVPDWKPLTKQWKKYSAKIKIEDPRIASVIPGIAIVGGEGKYMEVDCVSFTFDPAANQGISPAYLKK